MQMATREWPRKSLQPWHEQRALVSWNRNVLFADPPPLAMKWKWYSLPCVMHVLLSSARACIPQQP